MTDQPTTEEVFSQIGEHHPDCFCVNDPEAFVLSEGRGYQDPAGNRWASFECNDPECDAALLVRWDALSRFVTAQEAPRHDPAHKDEDARDFHRDISGCRCCGDGCDCGCVADCPRCSPAHKAEEDEDARCPTCGSDDPEKYVALFGRSAPCPDPFHPAPAHKDKAEGER